MLFEDCVVIAQEEYMWARMIQDIMKSNGILCFLRDGRPSSGPGMGGGIVLVLKEDKERAEEILKEYFPAGIYNRHRDR